MGLLPALHGPSAGATCFQAVDSSTYGGLMSQGYVPPGQFEDLLNLVRQSSSAAERAMNAAKYSEMAASAAGTAGQQAVVRAMHMASSPGGPAAAPFSTGIPGPSLGVAASCALEPGLLALVPSSVPKKIHRLSQATLKTTQPNKRASRLAEPISGFL